MLRQIVKTTIFISHVQRAVQMHIIIAYSEEKAS